MLAHDFTNVDPATLKSTRPLAKFSVAIATNASQAESAAAWEDETAKVAEQIDCNAAAARTAAWWNAFWSRSWILVDGAHPVLSIPGKSPLRLAVDSNGSNRFAGQIANPRAWDHPLDEDAIAKLAETKPGSPTTAAPANISTEKGFTVAAWIKPAVKEQGRIFDKLTAGGTDGFLFDTFPGLALRLIVGRDTHEVPGCLKPNVWQHVAATTNAATGEKRIFLDGKPLFRAIGSSVTGAYVLQRWITACAGRGNYPIKFNGSIFTVDPKYSGGPAFNADWRRWGDSFWWQNTRLPYFPMIARGDFDELPTLFRFYRNVVPLCKARARLYHDVEGVYFPETMTNFGTYANGDYGWDRTGHKPSDILCPYWQFAWQQGLELTALMLDYYEHTEDSAFLADELIPMAHDALRYYDTRFQRDGKGKLVISPTQAIETYWFGVVNDTPSVAGLRNVLDRLLAVDAAKTPATERDFWRRLRSAAPPLPLGTKGGKASVLPAEKFNPQRNNCENPELYAVWPFPLFGVGRPDLGVGIETFERRIEKASFGWQYDGQSAAIVGLAEDARHILLGKIRNSHPGFRFPAMWGPNYDWLPDQDHGSNIMLTLQHMLLDNVGGAIYVLPAWPKDWDVSFKLYAPRRTVIECVYRRGAIEKLEITPLSRRNDVRLPAWLNKGNS